jgi:ubiquinone/menaquinone biosynthesis C-methylase UbiE
MTTNPITINDIYGDPSLGTAEFENALNRNLNPRPSTMLYDKIGSLGLASHHLLLDVGCRDARHTCELVRRYGCRAIGFDPVANSIQRAQGVIAEAGLSDRVRALEGRIEQIPADDVTIDYIWCRDMLNHVPDLAGGLAECVRVLKPGGAMLVYQTFATALLEPGEAARLYTTLAVVATNMSPIYFEQAATAVGLTIEELDITGSEWREWWEEHGPQTTSKQLLTIARLHRDRERLQRELGQINYEVELADCHWGVYQMLGKLQPRVYTLRKVA